MLSVCASTPYAMVDIHGHDQPAVDLYKHVDTLFTYQSRKHQCAHDNDPYRISCPCWGLTS